MRKGVYRYENMDNWKQFNETSLREKEDFYSHLNMENITDAEYALTKRVCNKFEIKNLGKHLDFCVQSDTLMSADVFENFEKMYLEIYDLDLGRFVTAPLLAWQAVFKRTKEKLDLLTDINMLLIVEKGIGG